MKSRLPKLFFVIFLLVICAYRIKPSSVQAQTELTQIAISTGVSGDKVSDAQIICSDKDNYILCDKEYSPSIYGVVNQNPSLEVASTTTGFYPVVTASNTKVQVNSNSGNISVGDYITSSTTPGVGQKAIKNGFVLGIALENYNSADTSTTGSIFVAINPHSAIDISDTKQNLLAIIREGLSSPTLTPLATIRYLTAALMVIIALVVGFIYFGRVAKAGVEAIGRNPLSSRTIQSGVVLHIFLTIVIIAVGLGVAYLILTL